jgi:hypothetical protein
LTATCDTIDSPAALHPIPTKDKKVFVFHQGHQALLMGIHSKTKLDREKI